MEGILKESADCTHRTRPSRAEQDAKEQKNKDLLEMARLKTSVQRAKDPPSGATSSGLWVTFILPTPFDNPQDILDLSATII